MYNNYPNEKEVEKYYIVNIKNRKKDKELRSSLDRYT